MPIISDWPQPLDDDGNLTIGIIPPIPIGGMSLLFLLGTRFGDLDSNPLITFSVASGYSGASGLTITNSGKGTLQASFSMARKSGWDEGAYAYRLRRADSGYSTTLVEGFALFAR